MIDGNALHHTLLDDLCSRSIGVFSIGESRNRDLPLASLDPWEHPSPVTGNEEAATIHPDARGT
jgi:hypothetical protein